MSQKDLVGLPVSRSFIEYFFVTTHKESVLFFVLNNGLIPESQFNLRQILLRHTHFLIFYKSR